MSRLNLFAVIGALLSLVLALPTAATAGSPDARIDQQIRPCFGLLLDPNLSKGCKTQKAHRRGPPRRPHGQGCPPGQFSDGRGCVWPPRYEIDCDTAYPGQISDTISRYYGGETLTLTSRYGGACVDSLQITRSIIIQTRDYTPGQGRPILKVFEGRPCVNVSPGVEYVVLKGLGIEALRGGQSSCISGRATEIALEDVVVRYDGDKSAFDVSDSRIELSNVSFIGRTRAPVLQAKGVIMASKVHVASTAIGAVLETSGDSRLRDFDIVRLGDWSGSSRTRNSAGFVLSGMNRQQLVQIENLRVDGFSRGIFISGGDETTLLRPKVTDSDWAVVLEDANLRVLDGELQATDVGIYADSGVVQAADNRIYGVMRAGIFAERGAQVRARDNKVFAHEGGCEALVTGYFDGALTCRPWFEAPELYRNTSDRSRQDFDTYWPVLALAAPAPRQPGDAGSLSGSADPHDASAAAGGPAGPHPAPPGGTPR